MPTVGIICEYNPFHMGHLYQLRTIRERLGKETAIVCVMSGNFVQRGGPAVFSKFARAAAAASEGADLVLELPTGAALSSAEGFARGAVEVLNAAGVCDMLAFGAETDDLTTLTRLADILCTGRADEQIRALLKTGISYAEARQEALRGFCGDAAAVLSSPNNILAVEYLKALQRSGSAMKPMAVLRSGTGHDQTGCSGSGIRSAMQQGADWKQWVPEHALAVYEEEITAGRGPVLAGAMNQAILYRMRSMPRYEFAGLPDATEGLGDRLWRASRQAATVEQLLELAKTRRYAMSRLRRMVLCAWLGIRKDDPLRHPQYLRVLAAGERGRQLLGSMKQAASLPILVRADTARKLQPEAREQFDRECMLTDLYSLGFPDESRRVCGLDRTVCPVRF